ncbi:uncharacterized protein EI90DRAFT_3136405 [Cantharellus anzutake]|uniref:uncharacterized protein n=1 Tax=Cantharellus anzutake TaxID=1750568 RepID=UPI0019036A03|nr:uncharacterized protein EI90DRAFT_3136405 [Cantharellus anzutake]KAF8313763.1 hypothetical protein EI90DRAFT_3136405 [Cantharellus anzutake]
MPHPPQHPNLPPALMLSLFSSYSPISDLVLLSLHLSTSNLPSYVLFCYSSDMVDGFHMMVHLGRLASSTMSSISSCDVIFTCPLFPKYDLVKESQESGNEAEIRIVNISSGMGELSVWNNVR